MADVEAGASYSLEPRPNDRVRLLVIGDGGSGKSSLIYLACQGAVLRGAKATIGCHVDAKLHNHHGASFLVEFVEVGGAEKFRSARSVFFMLRFDGVVMLHDMTNRNSRANLDRWRRELVAVRDEGGADRDARRSSHQHARAADGGLGAHAAEPRDGACDAPRPWPPPTERSASGSLSRRHGGGAAGSGEWVDAGEMVQRNARGHACVRDARVRAPLRRCAALAAMPDSPRTAAMPDLLVAPRRAGYPA